uniref:Epidermal growth factor-like protein 7 n=1 Tax=Castor canadensis TaxID=51338 RepID=A0A8C0W735_CASCN
MWGSRELLLVWFLVLAVGGTEHVYRPSRRVCTVGAARGPVSESFVQRVYQPFLTTCAGHRACSTYRTIYRTAYRQNPELTPARPRYACCPGWKRASGLPGACSTAICHPPCGNGGSCVQPGRCHCSTGWQGDTCQTDVDECSTGGASCPQHCINTAGSYWCQCWKGHSPSADGTLCLPKGGPPRLTVNPMTGEDNVVREEMQRLQSRVDMLEQKLQLVLDPLQSLASRALEHGLQDPGSLLAHSFQQLDRVDSLSEQVSFLEEQLGSCECCILPSSYSYLEWPGGQGQGVEPSMKGQV